MTRRPLITLVAVGFIALGIAGCGSNRTSTRRATLPVPTTRAPLPTNHARDGETWWCYAGWYPVVDSRSPMPMPGAAAKRLRTPHHAYGPCTDQELRSAGWDQIGPGLWEQPGHPTRVPIRNSGSAGYARPSIGPRD
jgi:hypothetical protein